jgi:hypothetical protein
MAVSFWGFANNLLIIISNCLTFKSR